VDVVVGSATARSVTDPIAGFVLQHDDALEFYVGLGELVGLSQMRGEAPYALSSIAQLGDGFDLSSSVINSPFVWTMIEQWGPATGNLGVYWGVPGRVTAMAGGDFDGDDRADVAMIVDSSVQLQFRVLEENTCIVFLPFQSIPTNLAVGDHDGDGDDEIAIRFDGGNVAVIE
jgi:hypothetical protein